MFGTSKSAQTANQWYSVLASGPGIFGLGSRKAGWSISNPDDINGGKDNPGKGQVASEHQLTAAA